MLKPYLEPPHIEIINRICDDQIQSLIRVSMYSYNPDDKDNVGILLRKFNNLRRQPDSLLMLDRDSMSLFKHNLFNFESYTTRRSIRYAIASIWRQLDINEFAKISPI